MGIRGLSTYIAENPKEFLKPHKLCDTYLVVDGSNIAAHLYNWVSRSDSIFGGDYDEFYKTVKDFFILLKKCQVIPLVIFDGGHELKKLKTVISRAQARMITLRSIAKNSLSVKVFPLFKKLTFFQVMEDLNIFCFQCEFEADIEIAAVARALGCPVLSYDSDFYVYDVMYIPFSTICNEAVASVESSGKTNFYINCLIYNVNNLLKHFEGLDKSLLPIAATVLGNDYVEASVFQNLFNHISLPKNKKLSYSQRKIHGLFEWLKRENVDSAIKLILSHLKNKKAKKVMDAINRSVEEYTKISISPWLFDRLNEKLLVSKKNLSQLKLEKEVCQTCLPLTISESFYQCKIENFIVDMITLNTYFSCLQVESILQQSSHFYSLDLIKVIYKILCVLNNEYCKPLKMYLAVKNYYLSIVLEEEVNFLSEFNFKNIINEPIEVKINFLYKVLRLSEEEIKTIRNFSGSWILFVTCFLYWIKKLNNSVSLAHVHALILMSVSNQIVQKNVGYYRNHSKFVKKKGILLKKLSSTEVPISNCEEEVEVNFEKLLEKITLYECLKVQESLISLRQTIEENKKKYCLSTIHLFACFQSYLYHLMNLNAILNFPLPHLIISDFYSGTLLFNFYIKISQKPPVENFENILLKDTPNIARINTFLTDNLGKFSVKSKITTKPVKKKKKKKKKENVIENCENIFERTELLHSESESDYNDESNSFALLKSIS